MSTELNFDFFMSQIKHLKNIKDSNKTKISVVLYEATQSTCILRVCKNRDLSSVCDTLLKIKNRNVAIIYDYIYFQGNTYILEEKLSGETIGEKIDNDGAFSDTQTAKIIIQVCNGLIDLHKMSPPLIHNDINTSNIMICDDNNVKLFDFDISRIYNKASNQNTTLFGTEEYASPEHYGYGQSEPRTDIYSLGVTMHKMLTGKSLSNDHKSIYTGKLRKIVQKCIEINPKQRYQSVLSLSKDLNKFINRKKYFRKVITTSFIFIAIASSLLVFKTLIPNNSNNNEYALSSSMTENNTPTSDNVLYDYTIPSENLSIPNDVLATENSTTIDVATEVDDSQKNITSNKVVSNTSVKKMVNQYIISGELKSMVATNDGTLVYLEQQDDGYHLKTSNEEDIIVDDVPDSYSCELIHNPYSDELYLFYMISGSQTKVFNVSKDYNLTLKGTYTNDYYIPEDDDAWVYFFSDGIMYCNIFEPEFVNSNNWSTIGDLDGGVCFIIKDMIFDSIWNDDGNLCLEKIDFQGNTISRYETPIKIGYYLLPHNIYYADKDYNYIIGTSDDKDYIYKFDGESFEQLICLNDYTYYTNFDFSALCVTDDAVMIFDQYTKTIKKFEY